MHDLFIPKVLFSIFIGYQLVKDICQGYHTYRGMVLVNNVDTVKPKLHKKVQYGREIVLGVDRHNAGVFVSMVRGVRVEMVMGVCVVPKLFMMMVGVIFVMLLGGFAIVIVLEVVVFNLLWRHIMRWLSVMIFLLCEKFVNWKIEESKVGRANAAQITCAEICNQLSVMAGGKDEIGRFKMRDENIHTPQFQSH